MGRRSVYLGVVVVAVAVGVVAYRIWPEQPEERPADVTEQPIDQGSYTPTPVSQAEFVGRELVATLGLAPAQGFPAIVPWSPVLDIGAHGGFPLANLLHDHPLLFLELCADRFDRQVQGYTCSFVKKERIDGKLFPPGKNDYEIIKAACREHPFSVFFDWEKHRRLAARALYVEGENDDKILARPFATFLPIQARPLDDPQAKKSGRYSMAKFGMGLAIKRTVAAMKKAQVRGTLHLRYVGEYKVREVGDRVCYKFVRTPYEPLEEDALNELILYIDKETWMQVGSVLKDPDGNLLAEYFFRDIEVNPEFADTQFTRKAL